MPFLALPRQPGGVAQATKQDEVVAGTASGVPSRPRKPSGSLPSTSAVASTAAYAPAMCLGTQQQQSTGDSEPNVVQQLRRSGREQRRHSLLARAQACELLELAGPEDLQVRNWVRCSCFG